MQSWKGIAARIKPEPSTSKPLQHEVCMRMTGCTACMSRSAVTATHSYLIN